MRPCSPVRPIRAGRRLAALASVLAALPATAQTPPPADDEVYSLEAQQVTAQKRVQAIQEVPIALAAYSGTALETLGIASYRELAPFVPGLFVQEQSPNFPGLNMRGIATDSTDPRAETRVSTFFDGVSISRAVGSVVEFHDLERVEVLKGPQGTLFGRSAEVGAISLISRRPVDAQEASLTLGAGSYAMRHVSGHVNTPLGGNRLLGRVAFTHTRRDGFQDNLVDGSTLNGRDTFAVRPSLRWLPGDRTTIDLSFNYQHDDTPGVGFKSMVIPTTRGDTNPFTAAELNRGRDLGVERTVWGPTGIVTHDFGDAWTLTATTGVRDYDALEHYDGDGSRLPLLEFSDRGRGSQFSQELRLNFDAGGRFAGFFGGSYFHESGTQHVTLYGDERQIWPFFSGEFRSGLLAAGLPAALVNVAVPTLNPFQPQATLPATFAAFNNPLLPPPLRNLAFLAGAPLKASHVESYINSGEVDAFDLFADGTWRVTPRLDLTAGLRVSFEESTSGYEVINSATPSTIGFLLGASPNLAFIPTGGRRTADVDDTAWAGRVAARYQLTREHNAFATIARGRRPATVIIGNEGVAPVSEEVVWNYEIGLKGLVNNRLDYSASVFTYDYTNFQTSVRDPANAARFITINAGNATGQGAELALRGRLTDTLTTFVTYGYTDATFDDVGDNGEEQRFAGSTFRLTSRHTLALGATVRLAAGRAGRFEITPIYQYKSAHFFDDDNSRFGGTLRQPGFGLVNLRAAWRSRDGRWEAAAFAENLLDRDYLIDAGNFGANFGIPTAIRGNPRLWGVTAGLRF